MASRPEANFLQSWQWGEFHIKLGQKIERMGLFDGTKLVGAMMTIVEEAKRGRHLIVSGGPLIDWGDEPAFELCLSEMQRIAKENKCVFIRVRPQLPDLPANRLKFSEAGFRSAPMHLHAEHTSIIDLSKSEEELLAAMRKQTRYEIRRAAKEDIKVVVSTDSKDVKKFYELQVATAKRQKFVPFSSKSLSAQFEAFAEDDNIRLYRAYKGETLLAEAIIVFYGQEADYHYGASTEVGRKLPGAYAIQWEAIREAKRRGCARYNLWGIAPADKPKHRFAGVTVFKKGFGGEDFDFLHAQDLVISHTRYARNWLVETFRRKVRGV